MPEPSNFPLKPNQIKPNHHGLGLMLSLKYVFQVVQKTFIGEEKKAPSQVAGEILSFFTRNNFVVTDRGETIT